MLANRDEFEFYYEEIGSGEPLILVHGIMVDSWIYEEVARLLSKHYRVITYDRRGNSRSSMPEGADLTVEAQAEDLKWLLDTLGIKSAYIAGASAGAVITQEFIRRYPDMVKKALLFEPAVVNLILEEEENKDFFSGIDALVEKGRFNKAYLSFVESLGHLDERAEQTPMDVLSRWMGNMKHCLRDEFPALCRHIPKYEEVKKYNDKFIVATGDYSQRSMYVIAGEKFAERVGARLLRFPGCHNCPSDQPFSYASALLGALNI